MSTPMFDTLIAVRRIPVARADRIYRDVDHVDECGAPVIAADALDLGICENDMPGDTPVAIYGAPNTGKGPKTEGFLTHVKLTLALRDVERGHLRRIGARSFQVTSLKPATGPGLTPTQARRRHLAMAAQ